MNKWERIFFAVFLCLIIVNSIVMVCLGMKISSLDATHEQFVCPEVHVSVDGVSVGGEEEQHD